MDDNDHLNSRNSIDDEIKTFIIFMNGLLYETVLFPDKYDEEIVEDQIRTYLSNLAYITNIDEKRVWFYGKDKTSDDEKKFE